MRLFFARIMLTIGLAVALNGCANRLEDGGAYAPGQSVVANGKTNFVATAAPDMELFVFDSARNLAYSTLNAAFETERANRDFLWSVSPEIKHTLDKIRPQAKQVVIDYARARKAYLNNRTPHGLSILKTILGRLEQVAAAAQTALPNKK